VQDRHYLSSEASLSLVIMSPLAWLTITLLPYEVTALASDYKLGSAAAGCIVALEMLALATAVAWLSRTIVTRDKRAITVLGVGIALAASIGSMVAEDAALLVAFRILFGIGAGMVAAASNFLATMHRQPERIYSYMQLSVGIAFGISIFAAGFAYSAVGREAVFLIEAIMFGLLGIRGFFLPAQTSEAASDNGPLATTDATPGLPRAIWYVLAALAMMELSQAVVWAYAEQAGRAASLNSEDVLSLFTIAGFTTPLGGLAAVWMGKRLGYKFPLAVGFGVQIFVSFTTYCMVSNYAFIAGIMVFNMTAPFTIPFLLALMVDIEPEGRGAALSGSAINFGAAAGPALGAIVATMPSRVPIGIGSLLILATGLTLALAATRFKRTDARGAA
jgi:MFS family permease